MTGPGLEPRPFWNCTRCSTIELSGPPGYRNVTGFPILSRPLNPSHQIICWSAQRHCAAGAHNLLQHEKWPDRGSNPDPSGTAPDALPLSYQVLQGIAMWPDSPFRHNQDKYAVSAGWHKEAKHWISPRLTLYSSKMCEPCGVLTAFRHFNGLTC